MKRRRPGRMPSHHFLAFEEAGRVDEALAPQGFRLLPTCTVRDWRGYITATLVWYRRMDHTQAQVRLRVRCATASVL